MSKTPDYPEHVKLWSDHNVPKGRSRRFLVEKESDLDALELLPFAAAFAEGVCGVMLSHILYTRLDHKWPASLSPRIARDLLRKRLGFNGIVMTDDLEMGAIKAICPVGEAAILATQAGHDLLLVCHTRKAQREVFDKLVEAYKSKQLPLKELEESAARINRCNRSQSSRCLRMASRFPVAGSRRATTRSR